MLFMWVWCDTYIRFTAVKKEYNVKNTADGAHLNGYGEETNFFDHRQPVATLSTDCPIPNASEYLRVFVKPKRNPK